MANGLPATFVSPAMVGTAGATRIAVVAIVLGVCAVPAFPQSNIDGASSSVEQRSFTAAARYDPARTSPPQMILPGNLIVARALAPVVQTMLQRSAMFRRQVARIAGVPQVTVRVETAHALPPGRRAQTRLMREGTRRTAVIQIAAFDDSCELIAHELEHVIEQLDGIDLRLLARRRHSSVHTSGPDDATFETRRANSVGLMVAQEVRQWQYAVASLPPRR